MWEETGLHVKLTRILAVYGGPEMHVDYPNGDQASYVSTIFGCGVIGGHLHARDGEALDLVYYAHDELANVDLVPWTASVAPHLFKADSTPFFTPNAWSPPED
jgi:hypothetical protein